jgi:DNA-binding response OmpR family regulator
MQECSKIMLIDDNRDFLRVLDRFLARAGFKVLCLSSASDAMRHIEFTKEWPQAIVTDLHMPEMSGLEFIEDLGRRYHIDLPPILFLTSDESIESEINTLKRGAICFLPKSRDPRLLVAHLERVCGAPRSQEAA